MNIFLCFEQAESNSCYFYRFGLICTIIPVYYKLSLFRFSNEVNWQGKTQLFLMPNQYFQFKQFRIEQALCAMKVSTDACILGAYASKTDTKKVLDIGAGTGLLSLMIAQRYLVAEITALEIEADAYQQTIINFENSPYQNRLKVHHQSVQEFAYQAGSKYDFIISNPPFFSQSSASPNRKKNQARHQDSLDFQSLSDAVSQLLTPEGLFFVLFPTVESHAFRDIAQQAGLHLQGSLQVSDLETSSIIREINTYGWNKPDSIKTNKMTIRNPDRSYHTDLSNLLKDYYLIF